MLNLKNKASGLASQLVSLISQQNNSQPHLILLIIFLAIIQPQLVNRFSLYIFLILVTIFTKWNALFALPFWIKTHSWLLSILTLILSGISCTQKWKAYIFIFVSIVGLHENDQSSSFVVAVAGLLIVIQIGKNLIFNTVKENVYYFVSFFSLSLTVGTLAICQVLGIEFQLPLIVLEVLFVANLGYQIISNRINNLRKKKLDKIKDPHIRALCLQILHTDFESPQLNKIQLKLHYLNCKNSLCYCREESNKQRQQLLSKQCFKNAIDTFMAHDCPLLNEKYVIQLLLYNQVTNAVYFLIGWKPKNYFSWLSRVRCLQKVKEYLQNSDSSNRYQEQYSYALEYDTLCQQLSIEIYKFLNLKIQFWKQLAKQEPKLKQIQGKGLEAVQKMYKINQLYGKRIKIYEKSLNSFTATALFVTFLTSATSFKQYSKQLIKKTSKRMQDASIQLGEMFQAQTYSIRTIIRNQDTSYIIKPNSYFQPKKNPKTLTTMDLEHRNNLRMVISQVSSGVCELLKLDKRQIIGRQLNTLIPNGYKQVHNVRLSSLLNFNTVCQQILPSKVFHKQLVLPIRGAKGQLYTGFVCIRFYGSIEEGLSFVSIIKKVTKRTSSALVDFRGKITEEQEYFPREIVGHSQTQTILENIRNTWDEEKVIREENYTIMMNGTVYQVTISSPLLGLFIEKQNLRISHPPLHIEVKNNKICKGNQLQQRNKMGNKQLQNIDKLAIHDKQSSVASTQKSVASAVSVLSTFSTNNTVPLYRYIVIIFITVLALCLLNNMLVYYQSSLSWDGSQTAANPINEFQSLYEVVLLGLRSQSSLLNARNYYNYRSVLNQTKINQYLNNQNYESQINQIFQQTQLSLKQSLAHLYSGSSTVIGNQIKNIMETQIPITNLGQTTVVKPQLYQSTIPLKYHQVQMLCASDYNYLQLNKIFDQILVSVFSVEVVPYVKASTVRALRDPIIESLEDSASSAEVYGIVSIVCMPILIIPLFWILRKRFALHERVFDLLTSVDSEEVQREIKILKYTSCLFNNYLENSGQLKSNLINYQENAVIPLNDNSEHEVNNRMVMNLKNQRLQENQDAQETNFLIKKGQKSIFNQQGNTSIFKSIRKRLNFIRNKQNTTKKRKRMGELNHEDSQYDINKKLLWKHMFFYLTVLFFMAFMGGSVSVSLKSTSIANSTLIHIYDIYDSQINMFGRQKSFNYYMWQGSQGYYQNFGKNVQKRLIPRLERVSRYQTYMGNETTLIPPCSDNQTICQLLSSVRLMQAELESIVQQMVQLRYVEEQNNVTTHLYDLWQRVFYVQIISNRLYRFNTEVKQYYFNRMLNQLDSYNSMKFGILCGVIIFTVLCVVVGSIIIYNMKKKYLKQIYMLTFLNQIMILKNKRIQSYLDSLLKIK